MRRLLIFLVVLAVVLGAADFGLRFLSEYWVARQLQESLHLPSRPSVTLAGFPFTPRLVSGDFPSATVRTGPLTREGVTFTEIQVTLRDVHFSTRQLLYGKQAGIRARRGEGVADVRAINVTTTVLGQQANLRVRFEGGRAVVTSDRLQSPVVASVALEGSTLVVQANDTALPGSFGIKLPELVPDLRYARLAVAGSEAEVTFVLANPRFEVKA
jgi:hypothetical protein